MKRRTMILVGVATVVVAVIAVRPWDHEQPGTEVGDERDTSSGVTDRPQAGSRPVSTVKKQPVPPKEPVELPEMIALADRLNEKNRSAQDDLQVVEELIRSYLRYVGTVPEGGLNEEIVDGLRGNNPMKLIFVGKDHPKINEAGELLDRFGHPYYFHPVSRSEIEIRSAGSDGLLWSDDDVLFE
ncbi:hypothetical protein HAHE_19810 [Haloferula helveola]|uniref:Type II secretion system protein GspG C-terminal domain-containing protein n=1 Tax=Haloferula helveola TaxID=490095 RepID=A0ABN6H4Q4_9BACT|nr:hypothetical protein HAHE_19810 [Haloferula helveola]